MPGAAPHSAPSPLAPLLDTLAAQLHTPASAPRGVRLLMHTLRVLLTTFLCRKADLNPGIPGVVPTTAQHVFVAAATVAAAAAWLRRVPEAAAALPAMIGLVQMLLDLFAMPVAEEGDDGGVPTRSMPAALGRGNMTGPLGSPGRESPPATGMLSAISIFLRGVHTMDSDLQMRTQVYAWWS